MKRCPRCALHKPFDSFSLNAAQPDGYHTCCKSCKSEVAKEHYAANRDRIAQERKARRVANIVEARKTGRERYAQNIDVERERARIYYQANAEVIKARITTWAKNNPELVHNRYVRRRGRVKASGYFVVSNREMARLYRSACIYCGQHGNIQADHIIPLKLGGRHSIGNLAPACETCNKSKQAKTVMEWRLTKTRNQ